MGHLLWWAVYLLVVVDDFFNAGFNFFLYEEKEQKNFLCGDNTGNLSSDFGHNQINASCHINAQAEVTNIIVLVAV